jgi:hypothetical protein
MRKKANERNRARLRLRSLGLIRGLVFCRLMIGCSGGSSNYAL